MEDSERLSGEAVLSSLVCEQVVWWWTMTIARSISLPGLRDLLRDLLLLKVFWWFELLHRSLQAGPGRSLLSRSLLALLLTVSAPWEDKGTWS